VIALATALSACGGDDDNADETPRATSEATRDDADAETPAPTGDDDDGGGNGGGGDLADAVERFAGSTFTATYTATDSDPDNPLNGTMIIYKDGDDRFRIDVAGTVEGVESTFVIIDAGDVSGFCLRGASEFLELLDLPEGEDGVCFANDPTGGGFESFADQLRAFNEEEFEVLDTSEREIAGRDADCFRIRDRETEEVNEVCIDDDGVLLYSNTEGDTVMTLEATGVGDDPSDGDFELPYVVRELPGFGGG
jgi:hypothetical protein